MEPTTSWDEPAQQLRQLTDLVVRAGRSAPPPELQGLLEQATELLRPLAAPAQQVIAEDEATMQTVETMDHDRSMLTGTANPIAPPVRKAEHNGSAEARANLGLAYQGPPGRVHGGMLAALLDHTLGGAQPRDRARFTRTLTIDYLAGTPLYTDLVVTARAEETTGRKVWLNGEITVDGQVTARARGLWVGPRDPDLD